MKIKNYIKTILLLLLTFLLGGQTIYAKTELILSQNQAVFSVVQNQETNSLQKEVQPNIGFLKEKTKFVAVQGVSAVNYCNFSESFVESLAEAGGRFIANSGTELKTFLNGVTDLPTGVPYSGKLYRYKPIGATYDVMDINPNMNPLDNRFKTGLYASTSKNGNIIEVNAYGGTAGKTQYEISNIQLNNVLDLTKEATINKLGTSFEQMKLSSVSNKYEYTHVVADWAKSNGYSGVKFKGAHGSGAVYENIIVFEQSVVDNSILNSAIDPVSW